MFSIYVYLLLHDNRKMIIEEDLTRTTAFINTFSRSQVTQLMIQVVDHYERIGTISLP